MDRNVPSRALLGDGGQLSYRLHAGHFHAILTPVGECTGGGGQVVEIPARERILFQEALGTFHGLLLFDYDEVISPI
jgi:hypothetical protein